VNGGGRVEAVVVFGSADFRTSKGKSSIPTTLLIDHLTRRPELQVFITEEAFTSRAVPSAHVRTKDGFRQLTGVPHRSVSHPLARTPAADAAGQQGAQHLPELVTTPQHGARAGRKFVSYKSNGNKANSDRVAAVTVSAYHARRLISFDGPLLKPAVVYYDRDRVGASNILRKWSTLLLLGVVPHDMAIVRDVPTTRASIASTPGAGASSTASPASTAAPSSSSSSALAVQQP
jgi:hypothetical protein